MKQRRASERDDDFLVRIAPSAKSPREKLRLASEIYMNCFVAL